MKNKFFTMLPVLAVLCFALAACGSDGDITGSGEYTVWFNTGFADTPSISPALNVESGAAIKAPTAPSRDGFTFKGWYTDYGVDSATGLWKYEDDDKWNFAADAVTASMTLYAGWEGGYKNMPRAYYQGAYQNRLQGRLIQLTQGKTYKLGTRYFVQPGHGPVHLQARYGAEAGTTDKDIALQNTTNDNCFAVIEDSFTASHNGWYFIGLSNYNEGSDDTHGQILLHEIWLKEAGGGDINLLPNGDFVWKDAASMKFHETPYIVYPLDAAGEPKTEWDTAAWTMNNPYSENSGIHMVRDWNYLKTNAYFLYDLTGGKLSAGAVGSLVFPKRP
jgi:uncharacterized repeat protein (TIGR02543 family)